MGFELGTLHGSANSTSAIHGALDELSPEWLREASKDAAEWVNADFHEWKRHMS
jgi:hypothetical protein